MRNPNTTIIWTLIVLFLVSMVGLGANIKWLFGIPMTILGCVIYVILIEEMIRKK